MFNMSKLLIAFLSTEKLYKFPFKDTFVDSTTSIFLDMFPRQNCVEKLKFLLSALSL